MFPTVCFCTEAILNQFQGTAQACSIIFLTRNGLINKANRGEKMSTQNSNCDIWETNRYKQEANTLHMQYKFPTREPTIESKAYQ